jgi:photosystem II stability/assembly factor-like uncharacterized protein
MKKYLFFILLSASLIIACSDENSTCDSQNNDSFWIPVDNLFGEIFFYIRSGKDNMIYSIKYTQDPTSYLYRSSDNGNNWKQLVFNDYKLKNLVINHKGDLFYLLSNDIFKSTDNGDTWSSPASISKGWRLFFNKNDDFYIIDTYNSFIFSEDQGKTWISKKTDSLKNLTLTINSKNNIFIQTSKGIERSRDKGDTWTLLALPVTKDEIYSYNLNNSDILFLGTAKGNYFSTNDGDDWQGIEGLDNDPVSLFYFDKNDNIFVFVSYISADFKGLYYSKDKGKTWTQINNGIDFIPLSIAINDTGYVFIGTYYKHYRSKKSIY